jgi:hypothetical protein
MAIPHRTSLRSVSSAVAVRLRRAYRMRFGAQSKISNGIRLGTSPHGFRLRPFAESQADVIPGACDTAAVAEGGADALN